MKALHGITTAVALVATSLCAAADITAFTETFAEGNANWGTGPTWQSFEPLAWSAAGGPDGGAFVSATENLVDFSPGAFPFTLFRGQDNFGSSGGAFQGDWISANVNEFSFWVRHDATVPLPYFARFTPVGSNSPSMNIFFGELVQPNTWTRLSVWISPDNEDFVVGGGPGTYGAVFGNLGKMQLGAELGQLAGIDQDFNFDLALVSITLPAPGALALLGIALLPHRRRRHAR